jgi:hypothetical protein
MKMKCWWDYAEYHHEPGLDRTDGQFSLEEKTCLARVMRVDHSGESRFYVAPAADGTGTWYAWGEWHGCVDLPNGSRATQISDEADDATYTFADDGAFLSCREDAMTAIYRWIHRDLELDLAKSNAEQGV